MDDAKYELVANWLTKADRDLAAARKLASGQLPLRDISVYHCQQSVEKAIKGFFVFHDLRPERTHDLQMLVGQAIAIESKFASWMDAADKLTPYATAFLYPGAIMEPGPEEVAEALELSERFLRFVLSLLPEQAHPMKP
ncbi:MAG: HEPN domain-containing protein [Armatimonadetes bacterium]|nr:HEPN domain-containing protein [Armatimonadota bacterium]